MSEKGEIQNTTKIFSEYAGAYEEKFMDMDIYRDEFDLFCDLISEKNGRILEIGCGPGNCTRYLLEKRPDLDIYGIDVAPKMIDLARVNNPKARFERMDAREINKLTQKFDGIFCSFGLPYFSKKEAQQLIADAKSLLPSKGVIYLSTMEGTVSQSGYESPSTGTADKLFVNYHKADYLLEALKVNGFRDIRVKRFVTNSEEKTTTNLVIIAQC